MRKRIIEQQLGPVDQPEQEWINLETITVAELTSEDPDFPIESALATGDGPGWRASDSGEQTVRLLFDKPLRIKRIHLEFKEEVQFRTQEFVLRWSAAGQNAQEIVRQQYSFSPPTTTLQIEDYLVDLTEVSALELDIIPDINETGGRASLLQLLLA